MNRQWMMFWIVVIFGMAALDLGLGWDRFHGSAGADPRLETLNLCLRFFRTAFCSALTLWGLKSASSEEWVYLGIPAIMTVLADYYLVLQSSLLHGMIFFAIAQAIWWLRGLRQVYFGWSTASKPHRCKALQITSIGVLMSASMLYLLSPGLIAKGLLWPVIAYSILLVGAVVTGISAWICDPQSPLKKAFAIGMLLFFIGDIAVAIGAVAPNLPSAVMIRGLTGLFYTPALLLIGASGFRTPTLVVSR